MPAYNAEKTLEQTYRKIPFNIVEEVILSINFSRSVKYGLGVLGVSLSYRLQKWNLGDFEIFKK